MIISSVLFILLLPGLAGDTVVLRDELGEQSGTVLASDQGSLRFQNENEQLVQITWDQIRDIR
ncbi:MAG: hypothetical protein P8J89_08470, partial [Phycisphaerales bacterium]|nr:hypothetical protein [Phycisphaerales bacterium]